MSDGKQISSRGIAQESGLDVFSSIITYNGEYMNWGNAVDYGTQLGSDTEYATTAADPHIDALVNSPASTIGRWYRYRTSGAPYTNIVAPTSSSGTFIFYGQKSGGLPSYSGMYQKLNLIKGNEYQVSIQGVIGASAGTLYVNTYKPVANTYVITSTSSITYPFTNTSTSLINSTFTAESANDIIVLYFTTTSTSSVVVPVASISIKEKQEFLVPVYATDKYGNDHKVLRRNAQNPIPTTDA
jgi:hypothetical protein